MARALIILSTALIFVFIQRGYAENDDFVINPRTILPSMNLFIHEFIGRMCHGIPSLNIPILEPFVKNDPLDISFNNSIGQINGSISSIRVEGLSSIKVIDVSISPTTAFKFVIDIPKVSLKGKFRANGVISKLFNIDGQGDFDIKISSIHLAAGGSLKNIQNTKLYELTKLFAQPSISKLEVNIQKLVADKQVNDFINRGFNEMGRQLLQDIWFDYGNIILSEIEKNQKLFMKPISVMDLLKIRLNPNSVFKDTDPVPNCIPYILS